jgi:8-oxo-dGTP pyrophosphatase MutT (NUDIX family)
VADHEPAGASDPGDPDTVALGGAQFIPRPASSRPGRPAPWTGIRAEDVTLTVDAIRGALARAEPAHLSRLEGTGVRASAVLAPLYEEDGSVHVVLTRRAQHLRSHRGEVSFPGGGQELGEDLRTTALRESFEETGLDPSSVEIIGELDHLETVTSRSFITPFVGVLPGRPSLEPNPGEVEKILHVPLADLLAPHVFREERWGLPPLDRPIYFFDVVGDTIWGATAFMLRNFLALLTGTRWRD